MTEQSIPYNQIDFVIKAPRLRIVFSYMSNKGVAFIREYLLRLLKLTPCKPAQIAQYFGFSQHETEVALADLEQNKWITWQDDGLIALSAEGVRLFSGDSPQIPTLKEFGSEYRMELLDNNFLKKADCDTTWQQAIELEIDAQVLSEQKDIAQKVFQSRFRQLMEDEIISLNDKDIALYKVDTIETKGEPFYFRFTQQFELLPETGKAKERHDVPTIIHQDNIQQAITAKIEQFQRGDNLQELRKSMNELDDDDTLRMLFGGRLDFAEFLENYQKYEQKNGLYFLGQIYHQEPMFKQINQILNKLDKKQSKKCYWLAPSDIYWGKQRKIHDKIQKLVDESKNKLDFRLYLPLPAGRNNREKQEWERQLKGLSEKNLYGFCEGFLNGNTEILFLEDEFTAVCYHAKLNGYPVTLPIGFMTTKIDEVKYIVKLVESYLASTLFPDNDTNEQQQKDFGLLNRL
ncbi:hypothetical protein [Neisseria weaveri]|uniref:Uncharacterized protein n=1 Tax=Neisseria weaveri TaxID=28091 RepID=A0A448VNQ9_9NEIS|nr:hypothetical protein [Neisseria weaveri]EGV35175.1 hypothetical protein l11_21820 [Neisseria weaveri LMG 5135]VEJ51304.1 Uncharacterised protein [Neisseria weaveri]